MAKRHNMRRLPMGPPPSTAIMVSPRRRKRNAGAGASIMSGKSPIVPILAGAGGALVAVVGADKLGVNPNVAAWGTAAAGAATALGTEGVVRQVATGVGAAGMCLGALQLIASGKAQAMKKEAAQANAATTKRQAEGDNFVTQQQLNDALARVADQQQKGHCDLLTALDDIKKIVAASPEVQASKPLAPPPGAARAPQPQASASDPSTPRLYTLYPRGASVDDDYTRNAYGDEDARNADVDDWRNADVDDERNADIDDERNADVDDERNAGIDDERNTDVDDAV